MKTQLIIGIFGSYTGSAPWSLGDVALTTVNQITDENPSEGEDFTIDGDTPIVMTSSLAARTLTLNGSISSSSSDKATLDASYCIALRAMRGTVQTLVDPRMIYTGEWLVRSITLNEVAEGDKVARFMFRIVLKQSTEYLDLSQTPEEGGPPD